MATKKTTKKKTAKKAPAKKAAKKAPAKKAAAKKTGAKKSGSRKAPRKMPPKATAAVKSAADALWDVGVKPHTLLKELHDVMLLRCLNEAGGNYAAAAEMFGPSRQSVQQYTNSPLRDSRWKPYQQNRRRAR